jgi:hypothetical protein
MALLARLACLAPGEAFPRDLLDMTLAEVHPLRRADGLRRLGASAWWRRARGWLRLHRLVAHFVRRAGIPHLVDLASSWGDLRTA